MSNLFLQGYTKQQASLDLVRLYTHVCWLAGVHAALLAVDT